MHDLGRERGDIGIDGDESPETEGVGGKCEPGVRWGKPETSATHGSSSGLTTVVRETRHAGPITAGVIV